MFKIKAAILEDNKELLKDLKINLEQTDLVDVIIYSTSSADFLEKINNTPPEILLLDIDLGGDSMSGIDIANKVNLPVLFVSGKTVDFFTTIEELNINKDMPLNHITKPITLDKLNKILPKFIREINNYNNVKYVYLNFPGSKNNKIEIESIVCIETETGNSGKSGNKKIFFNNRKPETLIDIDFSDLAKLGISKPKFIETHRSFRVNGNKILRYDHENHKIELEIIDNEGVKVKKTIPVSDNFKKEVRNWIPK